MTKPKSNTASTSKAGGLRSSAKAFKSLGVDARYMLVRSPVSRAALERSMINLRRQACSSPLAVPVLDDEGRPLRPHLTVAIDEMTRAVVGWHRELSPPPASA